MMFDYANKIFLILVIVQYMKLIKTRINTGILVHSSNSNILAMVSAHSVPNKLASHHDSKDRLQVSSNKRLTMGQRSSFFRSSAILRSPPDLAKIKEYFRGTCIRNDILILTYNNLYTIL